MRTITRRWPGYSPIGSFPCLCDICGVPFRRELLHRGSDGLLRCSRHERETGDDLDRHNARFAAERTNVRPMDGTPPSRGPYEAS